MPESRRLILLSVLLLATACGGSDSPEGDPDGSLGSSGSRDRPDRGVPAESIGPNDTEPWVATPPDSTPASAPSGEHPWVNGEASGGSQGSGAPMLVNVRTARQDGFDRIVFEFDSHVPVWRASYVDRPQYECGSGEAVRLEGDGWLQVNFEGANAHTEEGRPTAAPRHVADPAGANLREMRRICDFEAQVQYVVGVGSPNRYRAFQLTGPARLVVDIQQ